VGDFLRVWWLYSSACEDSHPLTGGKYRVGEHDMYIGTRCNGYDARMDNDGAVTKALETQALDLWTKVSLHSHTPQSVLLSFGSRYRRAGDSPYRIDGRSMDADRRPVIRPGSADL